MRDEKQAKEQWINIVQYCNSVCTNISALYHHVAFKLCPCLLPMEGLFVWDLLTTVTFYITTLMAATFGGVELLYLQWQGLHSP